MRAIGYFCTQIPPTSKTMGSYNLWYTMINGGMCQNSHVVDCLSRVPMFRVRREETMGRINRGI